MIFFIICPTVVFHGIFVASHTCTSGSLGILTLNAAGRLRPAPQRNAGNTPIAFPRLTRSGAAALKHNVRL